MASPWLASYPLDVPAVLPNLPYRSLAELLTDSFEKYGNRDALKFMGRAMTFAELDRASRSFASYLQSAGLARGDRVAVMMPNVLQYPIAVAAIVRAGFVVVNTNPLYTPRELEHQLRDSGAKAIVVLENMASTLVQCIGSTFVETVVIASVGDLLPPVTGLLVNFVLRHVKKMVPPFDLPKAVRWNDAMRIGEKGSFAAPDLQLDDLAALQYTGGTTGISKGAMLTHRNVVANVLQSELWNAPALRKVPDGEQPVTVCALPLYHIFGFTVNMMLSIRTGGCSLLIVNPRDIPAVIKTLRSVTFHSFPAVNTLFAAIARHPDAVRVDWSNLRLSVGGGMAVQSTVAQRWKQLTGTTICEGYGLSETSPSACCNPIASDVYTGTIGLPLPSTDMRIIGDDGREMPVGERGELAISGPQVMAGYWNRPEDTKAAMTDEGFFRTGDIGIMDERGYFRIVDRKKDMINVSGFNVYPNEVEEVVHRMPGIIEAAAIGVPDDGSGEAVKLFVVRSDPSLTEEAVKAYCRSELTNYKRPKHVEFLDELPKTNVGKVLRRALRTT